MYSICSHILLIFCLCGAVDVSQAPEGRAVKLLVIGRTGSGKSTLINSILGRSIAKVGHRPYPETKRVQVYHEDIDGVSVTVCDTPGLGDATSMENYHLNDIRTSCRDPDLVLFCLSMDNTRWHKDDFSAIASVTEHLGRDIWKHFVLVLTFADRYLNNVPKNENRAELFQQRVEDLTKLFRESLSKVAASPESNEHRVYSAVSAIGTRHLPGVLDWLTELVVMCLSRAKDSGGDGLREIVINRMKFEEEISEYDFNKPEYEQPIVVTRSLLCFLLKMNRGVWIGGALGAKWLAAKFGAMFGGPAGFIAGGLTGLGYGLDYMIRFICPDWNSRINDEL